MVQLKIALDAGHGLNTAGKRCSKKYDLKETREWTLNNRVVKYIEEYLLEYKNVTVIRTDDRSGKSDIALTTRATKANSSSVDLFVSCHHNAGGGEGFESFVYKDINQSSTTYKIIKEIHQSVLKETGQRDRGVKKNTFTVLQKTKMPAVLLEFGFMDHAKDTPQILKDDFAKKCAQGVVNGIVMYYQLSKQNNQIPIDKNSFLIKVSNVDKGDVLNIRKTPSASANITGKLKYNDPNKYTIVETKKVGNQTWGKLKSGKGWINLKYTKKI